MKKIKYLKRFILLSSIIASSAFINFSASAMEKIEQVENHYWFGDLLVSDQLARQWFATQHYGLSQLRNKLKIFQEDQEEFQKVVNEKIQELSISGDFKEDIDFIKDKMKVIDAKSKDYIKLIENYLNYMDNNKEKELDFVKSKELEKKIKEIEKIKNDLIISQEFNRQQGETDETNILNVGVVDDTKTEIFGYDKDISDKNDMIKKKINRLIDELGEIKNNYLKKIENILKSASNETSFPQEDDEIRNLVININKLIEKIIEEVKKISASNETYLSQEDDETNKLVTIINKLIEKISKEIKEISVSTGIPFSQEDDEFNECLTNINKLIEKIRNLNELLESNNNKKILDNEVNEFVTNINKLVEEIIKEIKDLKEIKEKLKGTYNQKEMFIKDKVKERFEKTKHNFSEFYYTKIKNKEDEKPKTLEEIENIRKNHRLFKGEDKQFTDIEEEKELILTFYLLLKDLKGEVLKYKENKFFKKSYEGYKKLSSKVEKYLNDVKEKKVQVKKRDLNDFLLDLLVITDVFREEMWKEIKIMEEEK